MVTNVNNGKGGEIVKKKPAYPILAQLMAKHGMTKSDISNIIGVSYRNTLKKLNKETTFNLVEAGNITKVFRDLGETFTVNTVVDGEVHEVDRPIMVDDIFFS